MHTDTRKRLTSNILALYVLQGLNYVIPILVLPFLVRRLGVAQYGLLAITQSFAQYFTLVTDYGFNLSATRSIVAVRNEPQQISRIFSAILFIKLVLFSLGLPIMIGTLLYAPQFRVNATFFGVAYLAVVGNVIFPTWLFQGLERMRYISILIGSSRVLAAASLFIFVRKPSDALLALFIQSIATVAGGVAGLVVAMRVLGVSIVRPLRTEVVSALTEGWHLFLSTAAVSLYTNTNVILVGALAGNTQAGYFSAAEKLIRAMQGLLAPLSQALFPHMSGLVATSKEAAVRFAAGTLRWVGSIAFGGSALLFVFAHPIVMWALGPQAEPTVATLRWIAPIPFLIAVSNVLGIQVMIPFGLDKQFSRVLIGAGVLNVLLALVTIPRSGSAGAGQSVLITEGFVTLAMSWILYRSYSQANTGRLVAL